MVQPKLVAVLTAVATKLLELAKLLGVLAVVYLCYAVQVFIFAATGWGILRLAYALWQYFLLRI